MKKFILFVLIALVNVGCTYEGLNLTSSQCTLTLNVNWDEAVANESTNKVIEDAIKKGYKVYAGIIKSSEVDKSGIINFKEKQEISYRINKSIKFTIKESDYTKYHICIFIDKDGDGILSSWNNETIAYNYSLDVNSTSQTINMPIKINIVTSSSNLTFNVTWKDVIANKTIIENKVIEDAITKGYKLYLGILKESDMVKGGIVKCTQQQEINYKINSNVVFTIPESDYTTYRAYLYIDKDGDGKYNITSLDAIEAIEVILHITVNSTSQIINMPITINSKTSSSNLTFNVTWKDVIANKTIIENKVIEDAITKGYKLYLGILKESDMVKGGIVKCTQQQEINYKINSNVVFTIPESDYTTYRAYLYIDKDGDGKYNITSLDAIEAIEVILHITVNSTSQTINMPIDITHVTSSSNLTFNVTWNQGIANGVEKSIIDEAISKGYKAYIGIAKKSDVTRSGIFNFYEKQEIEYYGNKNVKITIKEADYGIYTLALFIDRNGDGADHWMDDIDMISFKDITVNSTSQTLDVSVNIN